MWILIATCLFATTAPSTLLAGSTQEKIPSWVKSPKIDGAFVYSLGEAKNIESKEDALERSWISGLLRIGMTQFPELASLKSESSETLHDANYSRRFAMKLDGINWTGLREAEDLGSPYVVYNEETSRYTVYRLLRWSKADIALARKKISKSGRNTMPLSPEAKRKDEEDLIDEVRQIQSLNAKLESRDQFVGRIMSQVRCGTTIENLIEILGNPDRDGEENRNPYMPSYSSYWGTFKIVWRREERSVQRITNKNGEGSTRFVCKD